MSHYPKQDYSFVLIIISLNLREANKPVIPELIKTTVTGKTVEI
jgi:hypothetical protein